MVKTLSFRQQIAFLRSHGRSVARWPIACGVIIICVWLWVGTTFQHEKKQIRERAYSSATTQAQTYSDQIDRSIGQLDYIMQSLRFQWQENGGRLKLEKQMSSGLVPKAA